MSEFDVRMSESLNQMVRKSGLLRYFKQPRYRYFLNRQSRDMYFWTTEKIDRGGKPRFVSGVYRYYKTKKTWKPLMQAGHAKRTGAKDRARKLYERQA